MSNMSIRPLPEELEKKAKDELNENPQRRDEDIEYMQNWLAKQPHLNVKADDQLILSFLRGCKFSYEKTKEKIDNYYTTRTLIPEIFTNRDPLLPEIQNYLKSGRYWLPLPKSNDPLAPRVFFQVNDPCKPTEDMQPVLMTKVNQMIFDIMLKEDDAFAINGFHAIVRMNGFSAHHLTELSPNLLKKLTMCATKRYPTRIKGFHHLDVSPAFYTLFNISKHLVSKKTLSRVYLHKSDSFNELHKIIPKSNLPVELGGEIDNVSNLLVEWNKKIESYRDWFLEDEKYCSEESKRIGKPHKDTEFFEIEGSFRKLEID